MFKLKFENYLVDVIAITGLKHKKASIEIKENSVILKYFITQNNKRFSYKTVYVNKTQNKLKVFIKQDNFEKLVDIYELDKILYKIDKEVIEKEKN